MLSDISIDTKNYSHKGFAFISNAIDQDLIESLRQTVETISKQDSKSAGIRNLFKKDEKIYQFARSNMMIATAKRLIGDNAKPVKAILFDKSPTANWYVTWHQDLTIAVNEKIETPGYSAWSIKDGQLHVQPPAKVLENMVSLRVHLDDCDENNGAIKFIAGSHKHGVLESHQIPKLTKKDLTELCPAKCGDIVAMCPLILHASSKSSNPTRRRILHIEYTASKLENGLEWALA